MLHCGLTAVRCSRGCHAPLMFLLFIKIEKYDSKWCTNKETVDFSFQLNNYLMSYDKFCERSTCGTPAMNGYINITCQILVGHKASTFYQIKDICV